MKYKFETDDPQEAKRLVKANDMYCAIFDLMFNFFKKYKHMDKDPDIGIVKEEVFHLLQDHGIDIDDLT